MGARKSRTTEQQAYDRTSQAYNQASQRAQAYDRTSQARNDIARQGDQERTATRAQPSTSSYQQMHMKMLQDRAGSGQGPMARQDTANDQRMNMERQAQQERAAAERSRGRRRFSWQR